MNYCPTYAQKIISSSIAQFGTSAPLFAMQCYGLAFKHSNFMNEEKMMVTPSTQLEHLSIAQQFSNEMMERFNPEQVNEILHHIKQMFKERREMEIAEAQNRLAYLQKTIESL